jgi:release factor H-coupled RctB family protein
LQLYNISFNYKEAFYLNNKIIISDNITIISSNKNWLEQTAIEQLKNTALLPGITRAFGLPDLHPEKVPVGAVFFSESTIYPHFIGTDIGCGMSFYLTNMDKKKINTDRLAKRLEDLGSIREIDYAGLIGYTPDKSDLYLNFGTIGGGNHFAELQEVQDVFDEALFNGLGLNRKQVMFLVHSGSRGLGYKILDEFIKNNNAQKGLKVGSAEADSYMEKHNMALEWAGKNRQVIAVRFARAIGFNNPFELVLDSIHNSITCKTIDGTPTFIHRKGAAPADNGAVIIPGSRGSLTYLVMPHPDTSGSGYSLAHGAGRKWARSTCKSKLSSKYTREAMKHTRLKGRVICNDPDLLYEEAPEAYKNIDTVIRDLVDAGLIKVIAAFKPILTYKEV